GETDTADLPEGFSTRHSFMLRPPLHRMLVIVAGPLFNFLMAWLLYWGLLWSQGMTEIAPLIGQVKDGSPAQEAGILAGDRVLAIDGVEILYWRNLSDAVGATNGNPLRIEVLRDNRTETFLVTPALDVRKNIFGEEVRTPLIGVYASGETITVPLAGGSAAGAALDQTYVVSKLMLQSIVKLFERIIPLDTVGGPIMIAQMAYQQAQAGVSDLLALTAFISINLAILNLLPIPVLDGGHLFFLSLEAIRRKPVSLRVQEMTTKVGLALLLTLMMLATYNDISRFFR
ncbi:MAG: RIP metalloprotease RseP, partial [Desulfovibrionaceae bacterium]